ncbi:protein SUPPRESSOR OF GENE SILENCING 3-like isoform X1 [Salvia splendens]|uniref:protein SUPPRESSOR OF GENE SILENCING 3-like isoform X1 n=1 Tax=Salvia splendens TaxID=180675 RepID=UPI001C27FC66|nr:protein SUPPRESSOR OF GENE SILENCING 3-like isoform X1 [Salvia splendens]XP_042018240.1 protein SUPPRESSOR OF GENE SILENCING 3-like isoform X1 [Salvia splendens]
MMNLEMSLRRGVGYSSDPSLKGKSTADVSNSSMDQLLRGVSDMNVNPTEDDGWQEYGKKSKNKNNASKQWVVPQHSTPKAWGHADTLQKLGMRTDGGTGQGSSQQYYYGRGYTKQQNYPVIPPPLKNGWGWNTRAASSQPSDDGVTQKPSAQAVNNQPFKSDEVDDESDDVDDSDDELMSDDFDSDESQKSHETRKKNKWFKEFFQCLNNLTAEQINEPERQHCPACQNGPGAITWYHGWQPLITHAKTKRSKRVKLHRELAEILDEELKRRGIIAVPAGEVFGKWKGLDERADKDIVWPPMVVILNTKHDKDDKDRWIGMGNQDLLEHFSEYSAVKACNSYGPQGHRGISMLIFEATAVGYSEADCLSEHFKVSSRDRTAWHRNKVPFYPGGQRQLYGYMAEKHDMEDFNQHSKGKSKLKYEVRSYQEMVVKQMKQMSDGNQLLMYFKNKVAKQQMNMKALEQSVEILSEMLRNTTVENQVIKLRTQKHHEQNKEEMDSQEQFYNEHIQQFYEREKLTESEANISSAEERFRRGEEISRLIQVQDKEMMDELVSKRDKLMKGHEERRSALKRKHMAEEIELEKELDEEFNKLMGKYTPAESK